MPDITQPSAHLRLTSKNTLEAPTYAVNGYRSAHPLAVACLPVCLPASLSTPTLAPSRAWR